MCRRVDELIRVWEEHGVLSPEQLAEVNSHLRLCPRCAAAYGRLLPLLRRDAGVPVRPPPGADPLAGGFTEHLMQRLARRHPAGMIAPGARARAGLRPLALTAAAAALVLAGFLGWHWGLRPGRDVVLVRFQLTAPEAMTVSLVGDFNGWDPQGLGMSDATGQGEWQITVRLKKGRVYTYNFLMDGRRWIADPGSPRQVADGFGGLSSVLEL